MPIQSSYGAKYSFTVQSKTLALSQTSASLKQALPNLALIVRSTVRNCVTELE